MPPLVIEQMTEFKRALLARETQQMRAMAQRWVSVERSLADKIDALTVELAAQRESGDLVKLWEVRRLERYQTLMAQTREELTLYTDYAAPLISRNQIVYGQLGAEHANAAIRAVGVRTAFDVLPVEAIQAMAATTADGGLVMDLLRATWGPAADAMTDAMIEGVALGKNPRDVARMMREGLSLGLNRTLTIARTEQLRVYREANRDSYIASDVVEGYRRLSAHDGRVCAGCLLDEGTFYRNDEVMPEHPNGRCTMVPVVAGFPPVEWKKGADWFREQTPAMQQKILGKGRFAAWQDGQFDLDQLVVVKPNAIWGDSIGPTALKELTNV